MLREYMARLIASLVMEDELRGELTTLFVQIYICGMCCVLKFATAPVASLILCVCV
jgi:hypothetical protein